MSFSEEALKKMHHSCKTIHIRESPSLVSNFKGYTHHLGLGVCFMVRSKLCPPEIESIEVSESLTFT